MIAILAQVTANPYMRVSKADGSQVLDLQCDALLAAGINAEHIYEDMASGSLDARPGLTACLKALREGDTLLVWKLDRLGRNLLHLINTVHDLTARGISFKVLTEQAAEKLQKLGVDLEMLKKCLEKHCPRPREHTRANLAKSGALPESAGVEPGINIKLIPENKPVELPMVKPMSMATQAALPSPKDNPYVHPPGRSRTWNEDGRRSGPTNANACLPTYCSDVHAPRRGRQERA